MRHRLIILIKEKRRITRGLKLHGNLKKIFVKNKIIIITFNKIKKENYLIDIKVLGT